MDSPREQGTFNLYEIVNEHNEPIMVFGGIGTTEEVSTVSDIDIDTPTGTESQNGQSNSQNNVSQLQASLSTVLDIVIDTPTGTESQNGHSNSQNNVSQPQASSSNDQTPFNDVYNFNENLDLPPFPDDYAWSSDDDNHSENDQIDYLLESDDNDDDEEAVGDIPPIRIPLQNYGRDLENENDFTYNWMWTEEDPGASYGPFNGNPGLNIQPDSNDPIDFFQLFFEDSMFTRIANETNNYTRQRIRNRTG